MALMACRECGREISNLATVCPHCGAPVVAGSRGGSGRKWTIGFLVALFALVVLRLLADPATTPPPSAGATAATAAATTPPASPASVHIESFTCSGDDYGWTNARLTVKNEGPGTLEYAQAVFKMGDEIFPMYLQPSTLPVGSLGTAAKGVQRNVQCQLMAIQGRDGEQVRFTRGR